MPMEVLETPRFRKAVKRLQANQRKDLSDAVSRGRGQPMIGEQKAGDLSGVRVFKFRMVNQLALLAYHVGVEGDTVTMIALGSHENFYRDLKSC